MRVQQQRIEVQRKDTEQLTRQLQHEKQCQLQHTRQVQILQQKIKELEAQRVGQIKQLREQEHINDEKQRIIYERDRCIRQQEQLNDEKQRIIYERDRCIRQHRQEMDRVCNEMRSMRQNDIRKEKELCAQIKDLQQRLEQQKYMADDMKQNNDDDQAGNKPNKEAQKVRTNWKQYLVFNIKQSNVSALEEYAKAKQLPLPQFSYPRSGRNKGQGKNGKMVEVQMKFDNVVIRQTDSNKKVARYLCVMEFIQNHMG